MALNYAEYSFVNKGREINISGSQAQSFLRVGRILSLLKKPGCQRYLILMGSQNPKFCCSEKKKIPPKLLKKDSSKQLQKFKLFINSFQASLFSFPSPHQSGFMRFYWNPPRATGRGLNQPHPPCGAAARGDIIPEGSEPRQRQFVPPPAPTHSTRPAGNVSTSPHN